MDHITIFLSLLNLFFFLSGTVVSKNDNFIISHISKIAPAQPEFFFFFSIVDKTYTEITFVVDACVGRIT